MAKRIGDDLSRFFDIDVWWQANEEIGELYLKILLESESLRYKTLKTTATVFALVIDEELPIIKLKEEVEQPVSELSSKEFERAYPERYRKSRSSIDFVRSFGVSDKYFRVVMKKLSYDLYDGTLPKVHPFNLIHGKSSQKLAVELFHKGRYYYLPVLKEYQRQMWQQWRNQAHVVEDGYANKSAKARATRLIERAKSFKHEEPLFSINQLKPEKGLNLAVHRIYYIIEKLRDYQRDQHELIKECVEQGSVIAQTRLKLVVDKESKTYQIIDIDDKTIIEKPDKLVTQLLSETDGYYLVSDIAKVAESVDILLFENIANTHPKSKIAEVHFR